MHNNNTHKSGTSGRELWECSQIRRGCSKDSELLIVGGIYAGKSHPQLVSYVKNLDNTQVGKVVLITSSASITHRKQKELREILTSKGIAVLDEITCPGALLFIKLTHPDKRDLQSVAGSARTIAAKPLISYMQ